MRSQESDYSTNPIHSIEAEQGLIGAIFLSQGDINSVEAHGGAEIFFDPVHAEIYRTISEKVRLNHLIDPITVGLSLSDSKGLNELGGSKYLMRLMGAAMSAASIGGYASALSEMAMKRKVQAAISDANSSIHDGTENAATIMSRLEASLMAIEGTSTADGPVSMAKAVERSIEQIASAMRGDDRTGIKSGIGSLDSIIPGFYPGELTILGGRPAMGKSALALSIALNAAREGHGVVIASLEMTPEAMATRAISDATSKRGKAIPYTSLRRGDVAEEYGRHIMESSADVGGLPIHFLPRTYSDIGSMVSGVKRIARSGNMRLVIVDYAQLMTAPGKSRYEQITAISLALKGMSVTLNVPVIALSQLSRSIESREDKRPLMSDLRESGQLEQDADNIIFVYRHEYYLGMSEPKNQMSNEYADWQNDMMESRGKMEVIVAKQRMGEVGTAKCRCALATNSVWSDD